MESPSLKEEIDDSEGDEREERENQRIQQESKKIQKVKHLETKKTLRSFWTHLKPLLCNNPLIRYSEVLKKFLDLCQGGSRFSLRKFNTLMDYFIKSEGMPGLVKIQMFCVKIVRTLPIISYAEFESYRKYLLNFCIPVIQTPIHHQAENQKFTYFLQPMKMGINYHHHQQQEGELIEYQQTKEEEEE
jgi:hypothetical protein